MKTQFIKINNISEINTSKISVRDLSNRYIDKNGKMYGLKYDRKARKVSIIQIIRTPSRSAEYFNQLLINGKREERKQNKQNLNDSSGTNIRENFEAEINFNPDLFINEVITIIQTHQQRLSGIMMNISNSKVISERDRNEFGQLNDIFRNIEIDGMQRIERILAYYRELKHAPRSISYYLSRFDSKSRKIIDEFDSDARKMIYIFMSEMYHAFNTLFRTVVKILADLHYFLNNFNTEDIRDITAAERQYFNDAKVSINNTTTELNSLLERNRQLEKYIEDPANF